MLFNSYEFLLLFLPVTLIVYLLCRRYDRHDWGLTWLVFASLFFYAWWNPRYLPLILGSMAANHALGRVLSRHPAPSRTGRLWLIAGIVGNLALLGYYKYAGFLLGNLNALTGDHYVVGEIVLPLAISFFTFLQIAYIVDAYRGLAREYSFFRYCLFVTFFPHLIAGPIVHYSELLPQFDTQTRRPYRLWYLAAGLAVFAIGLVKKAVFADSVAVYATPVFRAAETGAPLDFFTAWGGALAYTFQLYFDFSGYSDMAIGASLMFGVRLPVNFNSPYKSLNISDFWRRWHMTLSRFLRDYLYIALGGNRRGQMRRYVNLFLTMLLGGLWHGAAWTFVIWGGLHGLYLVINHAWARLVPKAIAATAPYRLFAWSVTFVAVVVGWVFFRAHTHDGAFAILSGMAGANGVVVPAAIAARLGPLGDWLVANGAADASLSGSQFLMTYLWVVVLFVVAVWAPNSQEITARMRPAMYGPTDGRSRRLAWALTPRWAIATGVVLALGVLALPRVSEFLYFQF